MVCPPATEMPASGGLPKLPGTGRDPLPTQVLTMIEGRRPQPLPDTHALALSTANSIKEAAANTYFPSARIFILGPKRKNSAVAGK